MIQEKKEATPSAAICLHGNMKTMDGVVVEFGNQTCVKYKNI
jgi:hypothetical protein